MLKSIEEYDRKSVSTNKDWCTPAVYADAIRKFFGIIELDPCSNKYSLVKAQTEFNLLVNGLAQEWNYKTIFVNPPYGRNKENNTSLKDWILRCQDSHKKYGSEVILLVPASTNTKHWQNIIFQSATAICFLKEPRVKFFNPEYDLSKGAPMACSIVYWGKEVERFIQEFGIFGKVLKV